MNLGLLFLAGAVSGVAVAGAQTHSTATHHSAPVATAPAAHAPTASGCVTVPELSPKIPALPAGTPCPKAMIAVSIEEKIDLSPLVGPALRQGFTNVSTQFTLAYQDELIGTGALAQPQMYYTVRYTGYLLDGTKFDSSFDHGDKNTFSFPYGAHRVIPGWDLGFEGMHIGGKRRLFIPYQLAYGERGRPPIPPKAELVFDMELVAQSPTDPDAPPPPPATPGAPAGAPTAPGLTPPPSAQPQAGPDSKPTPPTSGVPQTGTATPPTAKTPPPQ